MATSQVTPKALPSGKGLASKQIFNLETFEKEKKEALYDLPKPITVEDFSTVDTDVYILAYNKYQERAAKLAARKSIEGPNPAQVYKFLATFRPIAPYSEIKDRKEQTKAIMTFVKSMPALFEALKQMALVDNDEDSDGDGDGADEG